jgi:putative transposase
MKRTKFSEAQIAFVLKQADDGTSVGEVCRKAGISEATFYIYGRLSRCKRFDPCSRRTWVPTSIRRHQGSWRAQMEIRAA